MNLSQKEKNIMIILVGWTFIHMVLLFISHGTTKFFWPLDNEPELATDYDFSEFFVYSIIPWIVFAIYKIANDKTNK